MLNRQTSGSSEYKRNTLTRHMAILVSVLTVFYFLLALALDATIQPILFISMLACSGSMLLLIYFKRYELAKFAGLFFFMIVIYLAAATEDFRTGLHLHLITSSVVAIVFYGFHQWRMAVSFILFAFTLYMATYFYGFPWMETRNFPLSLIRLFFIINLVSCLVVSAYSIFLLTKLNHESENELQNKEEMLNAQNKALLKSNAELDRFVYSASHDLRSPLSSILGLVSLSEMSENKADLNNYLRLIRGRIASLDHLIHNIIDYSKNARQDVLKESITLAPFIESVIEDLRYSLEATGIRFVVNIELEATLSTDPIRLRTIVSNLVSNAIKYRDIRKPETIVTVSWRSNGDGRQIVVSDNGLGIEAAHQEKIFNMFFRGSQQANGSGLGLYIASEAAAKLGGKITLTSAPNKGATFTVHLP